jgi:hypothetical protein
MTPWFQSAEIFSSLRLEKKKRRGNKIDNCILYPKNDYANSESLWSIGSKSSSAMPSHLKILKIFIWEQSRKKCSGIAKEEITSKIVSEIKNQKKYYTGARVQTRVCGEKTKLDLEAAQLQGLVKALHIWPPVPAKIRNTNRRIQGGLFQFQLPAISLLRNTVAINSIRKRKN